MPSIASHFVVAYKVGEILNIKSDEYLLGNILPDIILDANSHYKRKGSYFLVPDISEFLKRNQYPKEIFLGYFVHLLLDYYFLEEFVPKNIKNFDKINLFSPNMIYNDYTNMNFKLVKKYHLNLDEIDKCMSIQGYEWNKEKYKLNVESIHTFEKGKIVFIPLTKFYQFLESISIRISNDIKEWI